MAEALVPVLEPLATAIAWPGSKGPSAVAAALALAAPPAPDEAGDAPWLHDDQRLTARRLVGAVKRHGGALLADPVGSGKTFVALAVANALRGQTPAAIVVPAALVPQWRRRAEECGVPIEVLSHTAVSRGRTPDARAQIVIIDESHHFRHPGTHRYANLSRALVGQRVLCVTATPVVNRLADLAHQLLLGVRDDALRGGGTVSLRGALRNGEDIPALGELIITTPLSVSMPATRARETPWDGSRDPDPPPWLSALDRLMLSPRGEVAALVRCVLLAAAASSPAALRAALGRYALLLRHAAEARRAGIAIDRRMLRQFTADAPEQLLLWEVMPAVYADTLLPIADLEKVERLRASIDLAGPDPKATTLGRLLEDGAPTLVFANAVATIPYLRDRLASAAPAWITGTRAGWRHIQVPREQVLNWFRPGAPEISPWVLLSSDVAAEGLDLQRAARVIHYDLPWTPMRLAQREGRSRRLGGRHLEVEVVKMRPPPWLERRLRVGATLQRKSLLGRRAGLEGTDSPWRWRHDLAAEWAMTKGCCGIAELEGEREELLVGLQVGADEADRGPTALAIIDGDGRWTESPAAINTFLQRIRTGPSNELASANWDRWRERLAPFVRALVRRVTEGTWAGGPQSPASRALIAKAQAAARDAARARDPAALQRAEELLQFAARGHTAGEEMLAEECLAIEDPVLPPRTNGPRRSGAVNEVRQIKIVGAIAVVPATQQARDEIAVPTASPSPAACS